MIDFIIYLLLEATKNTPSSMEDRTSTFVPAENCLNTGFYNSHHKKKCNSSLYTKDVTKILYVFHVHL